MPAVGYEWDESKRVLNRRKHGVDFKDAIAAVEDPNRIEEVDTEFEFGEERIRVIGGAAHDKILLVVTTLRGDDTCRIISARKATRHEQERYYAGNPETW